MKKNIAFFGSSGGLGKGVCDLIEKNNEFNIYRLDSKKLDIRNKSDVEKFFSDNDIDIVINFSAFNYDCFLHKYTSQNQEQLEKQLDVNIKGTINILSSCLPNMRKKKYGKIIFASSILSEKPVIGSGIYSSCKSFIETICKTAALENANNNITVNSIRLGYFDGGLLYKIPEEFRDKIREEIPMKRWGTVEELYNSIIFIINNPYLNGSTLKICGGL
jgi:NAD(P)-dependent dehydrogenase (short-subunit alcohol dehydrogenase family)